MTRELKRAAALGLGALLIIASGCHKKTTTSVVTPECTTRADCQGGVAGGLICVNGQCQGCVHSSDCRLNEACDPVQRRCTLLPCFGDQCTAHTDCALGEYCVQGLCLMPGPANAQGCAVILCSSDRDCNSGQVCNPQTFVCEESLGCDPVLAPCPSGEVCQSAGGSCVAACTAANAAQICGPLVSCIDSRCVQCAQDSDCGPGLSCDTSTGQCEGDAECTASRDCPVPETCDAPTGTCTANARPPCTSSETCATDERCQSSSGDCVAGACMTDRFYPNETEATAAPLLPGSYPELSLCSSTQESWFSLALLAGDAVQVVSDADPLGSFDMQLYAPDGTLLDEEQLAVVATAGSDGTYFIRIRTNDASVLYGLEVIERAGASCAQNPSGAHEQATAAVPLTSGPYGGFTLCAGAQTWFVLRADPDAGAPGIEADATLDPTQGGPLLLTLFDSDGQTQLAEDASGGSALQVKSTAPASAGNFFLRVSGGGPTVTNSYDLTVRSAGP